jgi:hypothetical protein
MHTTVPEAIRCLLRPSEIVRMCVTVKASVLVSGPLGSVTEMVPVTVPLDTIAVICVAESTVNDCALVPPNVTAVAPVSTSPMMTTEVPHGPRIGSKDVICGLPTVKSVALKLIPFGVVTEIFPVVAPAGTVAVILLGLSTVNIADELPNFTDVAPVKLSPLIVTIVPAGPLSGENDVISGVPGTVNFVALVAVPAGVVRLMSPVVVPIATFAVICVEFTTVNVDAGVALNRTADAPEKFAPSIVTTVPTAPLVGENEVMAGVPAGPITKSVELVAVPTVVVTVMGPVCVPFATVAVT